MLAEAFTGGTPTPVKWDQVFQSSQFSSEVLAEAVQQLHRQVKYDEAVEFMLASIRNDHAQPWTYDVLAIEMKLANRPESEINRVLQSRADFTAGNVAQQMLIAAMLSRFDAHEQAMEVCRRNADAAPESSEVWLQARSIADRIQSPVDQVWARCGILQHVWSDDYPSLHAEATVTIKSIAEKMERAGNLAAASQAREDLQRAREIDLRIIVEWIGEADLDLLVDEPSGSTCSFENRLTANGGRLVKMDSGTARGTSSKNREEYVCVRATPGNYAARIRFVFGKVVNGTAVVQIIQHQNSSKQKVSRKAVALARKDAVVEFRVDDKSE